MRRSRITIKIVALLVSLFRKEGTRQMFHLNEGLEGCLVSTAEIFLRSKINPFLTRIRLNSPLSSPSSRTFPFLQNPKLDRDSDTNWQLTRQGKSYLVIFKHSTGNIRMENGKTCKFLQFYNFMFVFIATRSQFQEFSIQSKLKSGLINRETQGSTVFVSATRIVSSIRVRNRVNPRLPLIKHSYVEINGSRVN